MLSRPIQLVLDFDGTLTQNDTLQVVSEAGHSKNKSKAANKRIPSWQAMVDAYIADLDAHTTKYVPGKADRKTLQSEFAWLDSLRKVESVSATRVHAAGFLDDISKQDMENAATDALRSNKVKLRPGWTTMLATADKINANTRADSSSELSSLVISVNWSRWFVFSVLWAGARASETNSSHKAVTKVLENMAVYANEIESIISATSSSPSTMPSPKGQPANLRTAGDKLQHMQLAALPAIADTKPLTIYIGDSVTDFECLVMADVGICIRDHDMSSGQKELQSTCQRIGIALKSLDEYQDVDSKAGSSIQTLEQRTSSTDPTTLYYAYDFHEVTRWLREVSGIDK